MGQDIEHTEFSQRDFDHYKKRLDQEFEILKKWNNNEQLIDSFENKQPLKIGIELEACLIDKNMQPSFKAPQLIKTLNHPQICAEIANFNLEFNSKAYCLKKSVFSNLHQEFIQLVNHCHENLEDDKVCISGILPTLDESHLQLQYMSPKKRYYALNEQILKARQGKILSLDISGHESLHIKQESVMMESLTTSAQFHLQVPFHKAHRYYNASIIASAPMVAVGANSPFLFGKQLWQETRIPVFEQSIASGGFDGAAFGPIKRAGFGEGYVKKSMIECFEENIEHYPILIPEHLNTPLKKLAHLQLHNGTIWRWNRPVIGIEKKHYHWRIEHRSLPAGPTLTDTLANAAFYYGLVHQMANQYQIAELEIPFNQAKENFYLLAKHGLDSKIHWLDDQQLPVRQLILQTLIPLAKDGLSALDIDRKDIEYYLSIIEQRTETSQTGANWQINFNNKYPESTMQELLSAYFSNQQTDQAVHQWAL